MNISTLQPLRRFFLVLSVLGFVLFNLPFLYFAFIEKEVYAAAMSNGVALVFFGEAVVLLLLFAFLIARLQMKKPGWFVFILLSLLGSMAFSVPLYLYLYSGRKNEE